MKSDSRWRSILDLITWPTNLHEPCRIFSSKVTHRKLVLLLVMVKAWWHMFFNKKNEICTKFYTFDSHKIIHVFFNTRNVFFCGLWWYERSGYPEKKCDLRLRVVLMFAACIVAALIGRMTTKNIVQPFMMTRFKLSIQDWQNCVNFLYLVIITSDRKK